jgi:hypothetical protein
MESNKNSLANVLLVAVTITAVFLVGFLIFGSAGVEVTDTEKVTAGGGESILNDEDQRVWEKERQAFLSETQDLRQDIYKKRLELQSELAKKNPDAQKAAVLHKDISKLTEEFDQKRLAFILKMKKINPDIGRMGLRGTENDEDEVDCPYYGRHMGRRHGYGMGPGMMGPGYGMRPGYGRGPGWMGRAPEQGEMGPRSNRLETPLNEDAARAVVENYLQSTRNPNLIIGKITEQGNAFEAEIVTREGSLVDKLLVDKTTGWMRPAN